MMTYTTYLTACQINVFFRAVLNILGPFTMLSLTFSSMCRSGVYGCIHTLHPVPSCWYLLRSRCDRGLEREGQRCRQGEVGGGSDEMESDWKYFMWSLGWTFTLALHPSPFLSRRLPSLSLSLSLTQNWSRGHHGDLCILETACEDPNIWGLHQHAKTARCVLLASNISKHFLNSFFCRWPFSTCQCIESPLNGAKRVSVFGLYKCMSKCLKVYLLSRRQPSALLRRPQQAWLWIFIMFTTMVEKKPRSTFAIMIHSFC